MAAPLLTDAMDSLRRPLSANTEGSRFRDNLMTSEEAIEFLGIVAEQNKADLELHAAATVALDEKVAVIGQDVVAREVGELKAMQRLVQQACGDDAHALQVVTATNSDRLAPPSDPVAQYSPWHDCLWKDQGCGHQCILRWASMYEAARSL